jgi:hypothetical protein
MNPKKIKFLSFCGKFNSIVGYILGSFFTLGLMIDIFDNQPPPVNSVWFNIIKYLILFALSGFCIYSGIAIKRQIKRYKNYDDLISNRNITSIQIIAEINDQSINFTTIDIQKMIYSGYLKNMVVDTKQGKILIGNSKST